MTKKNLLSVTTVLVVLFTFVFFAKQCGQRGQVSTGRATEVTWNDLYEYDYKNKKIPDALKKIDNTRVKIAGYIVPLTDEYFVLTEFLLVPNAQACIHVPPPPPNLIVHVKLDDPLPIEQVFNPAWIEGILQIKTTTSIHGDASYKMDNATLQEYKY